MLHVYWATTEFAGRNMVSTQSFTVVTFEKLRELNEQAATRDYYKPEWDQAKGVVRMNNVWAERLKAERGDLVNVAHNGKSATYILKMSPFLTADRIALDYDQQRQLGILNLKE